MKVNELVSKSGSSRRLGEKKALMKRYGWLSPPETLRTSRGSDFGRHIEERIKELKIDNEVLKLRLRRRDSAVVMSLKQYDELLEMKRLCEQLLEEQADEVLEQGVSDFDALYQRLTSQKSRRAADRLFEASAEQLRESYRPGGTEAG